MGTILTFERWLFLLSNTLMTQHTVNSLNHRTCPRTSTNSNQSSHSIWSPTSVTCASFLSKQKHLTNCISTSTTRSLRTTSRTLTANIDRFELGIRENVKKFNDAFETFDRPFYIKCVHVSRDMPDI